MMERHDFSSSAGTADDARVELSQSHASDDPEDANFQSVANDGVTDYENDDLSNNDEDVITSNSPSDNQFSSRLLAVNSRDGASVDGSNSQSVPVGQNVVGNLTSRRTAEFVLMDNMTRRDEIDGDREGLSMQLPSRGFISLNEDYDDDRDPNYATQRPDTLGAINVAAAAAAANAFPGPIARPVYQPARAWPMESAVEDTSFADDGTAQLGRRTCGAGMDQLELNQRQLMNADEDGSSDDDGDGSELCDDEDDDDTGLGNGNQCESTEADQYKMDPEADQSAGAVEMLPGAHRQLVTEPQQNGSVLLPSDDVRSGACGFNLGQRHRSDGAVSDVSQDMDDPEEDQADRAVSTENARLEPPAMMSGLKPSDAAAHAVPVASNEHKREALKQHPQSAFSIPKPRVAKSKSGESESASCTNRPVPSVRQSKSNTDIVFKPISTSARKTDSAALQTLMTSKGSDGSSVTGTTHGELSRHAADQRQLSAKDSGLCRDKKDADGDNASNLHPPGKPAAASGRSIWSREPLWNTMDQPIVVWNDAHTSSSAALPSACHLPGEGGAIAVGTFALADTSSQQATPQKTDTRTCSLMDNSLDMSPIQPASSSSSRPLSVNGMRASDLASVNDIFPSTELQLGTQGSPLRYFHKIPYDVQPEIEDMETVRGQLHQLLTMSERNIPDKALYDQSTEDVDELLTRCSFECSAEAGSSWTRHRCGGGGVRALEDVLPLSSRYLVSSSAGSVGGAQLKPDVAVLAAENRSLHDTVEQQRFKLKHCEKLIQQLQNKVLELQQNLAVAVSTDRKKDVMIQQLDKTLYKLVEGWRHKEMERKEVVRQLQLEKHTVQQAFESQQQVVGRFERQLKQTVHQLQSEQQRAANTCLEKDRQMTELQRECEQMQEELERARDHCRCLVDAEKRDAAAAKDQLMAQMSQLKSANEQERQSWKVKECHYLQKLDEMSDAHLEAMEQQKSHQEKQQQLYADLQAVVRTTQMQVDKLQLELDTVTRERDSLKVELSLAEARVESSRRKIEAEMQMEAEQQLAVKLEDASRCHAETERKLTEAHRTHLQDIATQQRTELERLADEHEAALRWLEDKHRQDLLQQQNRIHEMESTITSLQEENRVTQLRSIEVSSQLQSMMQSHCSEALQLLQLANTASSSAASSEHLPTADVTSARMNTNLFVEKSLQNPLPADSSNFSQSLPSVVEQLQPVSSSPASQSATSTASTANHLSAQYSQFLASVRDFKPLVADLNASIASIANSVTTMGADVSCHVPNGNIAYSEDYVGDVGLHSPVSQAPQRELSVIPDARRQQSQILHNGGSLFHQILDQRDLPNTSADSLGSELFDAGVMKDDDRHRFVSELPAGPSPLPQHDLRHQELQHYIRILLQRSPENCKDNKSCAVSATKGAGEPANASATGHNMPGRPPHLDRADGDVGSVLTPSQVNEIKKLLERQQQAALAQTSVSDESGQTSHYTPAPHQTTSDVHAFHFSSTHRPNPAKQPQQPDRNIDRLRGETAQSHAQDVGSGHNKAAVAVKLCKQSNSDTSVGPGRPAVSGRPQHAAARAVQTPVTDNGARNLDKKGGAKNKPLQAPAWK